jgi:hypothetical protein
MANLSIKELLKPGREFRAQKIVEKMKSGSAFELATGDKVKLKYEPKLEKLLLNKKLLEKEKNINFFSEKHGIISLTKIKKNDEFGGEGGSGLGAKGTAIAESLHALYAQSLYDYKSFSGEYLKKAFSSIEVTENFKDMTTMPDDWIASAEASANIIVKNFKSGKKVKFHRGSKWVKSLESTFNRLNKQNNSIFANINKWSPADIYMITDAGSKINFDSAQNLTQLNSMLNDALKNKDVIGISLKKVVGNGALSFYNIGEKKKKVEFKDYTVGKKNFFNSKDSFIFFEVDGQMQMRTFPNFRGEIKGKNASQGSIGYGEMAAIARTKLGVTAPDISDVKAKIKKKDLKFAKSFYDLYVELSNDEGKKLNFKEFVNQIFIDVDVKSTMNDEWVLSKYIGCSLIHILLNTKVKNGANIFVSGVVNYAASSTDLSAPFAKIQ